MPDLVDGECLDENWHLRISRFAIGHLRGKVAFCALGNERAKVRRRDRELLPSEAIAEAPCAVARCAFPCVDRRSLGYGFGALRMRIHGGPQAHLLHRHTSKASGCD